MRRKVGSKLGTGMLTLSTLVHVDTLNCPPVSNRNWICCSGCSELVVYCWSCDCLRSVEISLFIGVLTLSPNRDASFYQGSFDNAFGLTKPGLMPGAP
jgi:hypothetical protein